MILDDVEIWTLYKTAYNFFLANWAPHSHMMNKRSTNASKTNVLAH
jgi:hypothetical protein